jgi:hypothetical protein
MNMLLLSGRHAVFNFCCDVCRRRPTAGAGAKFVVPYGQHGINANDLTIDICQTCLRAALNIATTATGPIRPKAREVVP